MQIEACEHTAACLHVHCPDKSGLHLRSGRECLWCYTESDAGVHLHLVADVLIVVIVAVTPAKHGCSRFLHSHVRNVSRWDKGRRNMHECKQRFDAFKLASRRKESRDVVSACRRLHFVQRSAGQAEAAEKCRNPQIAERIGL